jgi:dephospho-CoA kinase
VYLIALTGGIASGKSLVASRLTALGAVHIDADSLAREVVAVGSPALDEIRAEFGDAVIRPDGSLDRAALAAIVFNDAARLARLNEITHPRVRALTSERIALAAEADPSAIIVYDVPLLAETNTEPGTGAHRFDSVVVVHADRETRIQRMVEQRGMARREAELRIDAQATDAERLAIADVVIENTGSIEDLEAQVDRLWAELDARRGERQPPLS